MYSVHKIDWNIILCIYLQYGWDSDATRLDIESGYVGRLGSVLRTVLGTYIAHQWTSLYDAIYDASYDVLFNCQILIQCTWDAHVKCWCIAGIFGEYNGLLMLGLCWRRFVKIAHSVYSWCIRMYAVWCMRMHDHIFLHTVNHTHTDWY